MRKFNAFFKALKRIGRPKLGVSQKLVGAFLVMAVGAVTLGASGLYFSRVQGHSVDVLTQTSIPLIARQADLNGLLQDATFSLVKSTAEGTKDAALLAQMDVDALTDKVESTFAAIEELALRSAIALDVDAARQRWASFADGAGELSAALIASADAQTMANETYGTFVAALVALKDDLSAIQSGGLDASIKTAALEFEASLLRLQSSVDILRAATSMDDIGASVPVVNDTFAAADAARTALTERLATFAEDATARIEANFATVMDATVARTGIIRQSAQIVVAKDQALWANDSLVEAAHVFSKELKKVFSVIQRLNTVAADRAEEISQKALVVLAALMGVSILFTVLGVYFAQHRVGRSIRNMTNTMTALAAGDNAIEVPSTHRHDEIGAMGRAVLIFKENGIARERLEAEGKTETARRERRVQAIETLITGFESDVEASLTDVSSLIANLNSAAATMHDVARSSDEQAGSVAEAAGNAASNVQSMAAATEELDNSIREIAQRLVQSQAIADQARQQSRHAQETVRALVERTGTISGIVDLIKEIAERTNLLALNATIEAARAGDAGKGFTVVASEVKTLASQTGKATEEITQQISALQEASATTESNISGVADVITQMNEIALTVASAMEQQATTTSEIARSVQQAANGTSGVTSSIVGVTEAASSTETAAGEVQTTAQAVSRQSEGLRASVGQFLKEIRAA